MAPRKKAEETTTKPSPTPATRRSARMTRSAAKRLNARLTELPTDARKKRKQGKAEESKKKVKIETETVTATSTEAQAEVNTLEEEEEDDEDEADEEDAKEENTCTGDGVNKTIVIEHCSKVALSVLILYHAFPNPYVDSCSKQCDAFKTNPFVECFSWYSVLLNPEKLMFFSDCQQSRRGCFEIQEEGEETFISLLNMKRLFRPLKGLDMDKVISNIIDRVKSSTNASD
ncbi:hypothetical protein POTOM_024406 [Populus tomentosa]|uniref:Uncharacterized protein n=1 Tax=Populus tomentosa TaxID=118781 RepID=A0A8X7ZPS0_POPTO|nr:hypothetical protein POTOM_024406 [Populus tomentosa]